MFRQYDTTEPTDHPFEGEPAPDLFYLDPYQELPPCDD